MPEISKKQLIGSNVLPTPYIEKISILPSTSSDRLAMEGEFGKTSGDKGLKIKIDLKLNDLQTGSFTRWFNKKQAVKYLDIVILESRDPKITKILSNSGVTQKNIKKYVSEKKLRKKIVSTFKQGQTIDDFYVENIDSQTRLFSIPYSVSFYVPNYKPKHLAYFAATIIDIDEIKRDFRSSISAKRLKALISDVVGEIAITNGRPVTKANQFILPNRKTWIGPYHFRPDVGYMAGSEHAAGAHPKLTRVEVPNYKIQDDRVFDLIRDAEYYLEPPVRRLKKLIKVKNADEVRLIKTTPYFTDAFMTKNASGDANILFGIDYDKILTNETAFGQVVENADENLKRRIYSRSKISSIRLYRRRVKKNFLSAKNANAVYNKFSDNDTDELIVFSATRKGNKIKTRVYSKDRDGDGEREVEMGSIREVSIANTGIGQRFFSISDLSLSRKTDGIYQYIAEVEIEDGTIEYIKDSLRRLSNVKVKLLGYYNLSKLHGNYSAKRNSFSKRFVKQIRKTYPMPKDLAGITIPGVTTQETSKTIADAPWLRSLVVLTDLLDAFTSFSRDDIQYLITTIYSKICVGTGSPQGILELIETLDIIGSKIREKTKGIIPDLAVFDPNVQPKITKDRNKKSLVVLKKTFLDVIDTNRVTNVSYDFLGVPGENEHPGLKEVGSRAFVSRMRRENAKLFGSAALPEDLDPLFDLKTTSMGYLTPAVINFDVESLNTHKLGANTLNFRVYNKITSAILAMKSNTTSNRFTPPIGFIKRSANKNTNISKESEFANMLSQVTLSNYGITIEPSKPIKISSLIPQENTTKAVLGNNLDIISETDLIEDEATKRSVIERTVDISPISNILASKIAINAIPESNTQDMAADRNTFSQENRKQEELGIRQFNRSRPENLYDELRKKLSTKKFQKTIRHLPNHIKALFLSDTDKPLVKWFKGGKDFLADPNYQDFFRYNYFMMKSVEVMTGFEETKEFGKQIARPKFKLLTPEILSSLSGDKLLCRLRTVNNKRFMISTPTGLDLPAQDEYFLLSLNKKKRNNTTNTETSFDEFAKNTMKEILKDAKEAKGVDYKYTTTLFIKQPSRAANDEKETIETNKSTMTATNTSPGLTSY